MPTPRYAGRIFRDQEGITHRVAYDLRDAKIAERLTALDGQVTERVVRVGPPELSLLDSRD